jgi:membrane-bound serine protease (ClpP class)
VTAGMIDEIGRALTPIAPGRPGQVATHGEIWSATAEEPLAQGEAVRVVEVNGLTLVVRRDVAGG